MNTDNLSRGELNELISLREAVSYAARSRQMRQFSALHDRGGQWAFDKDLQEHNQWLKDISGSDPHGLFAKGTHQPWPEATDWLIERGWLPGEIGAEKLIMGRLLEKHFSSTETDEEKLPTDPSIHTLLDPMKHHDCHTQSLIVGRILADIDRMGGVWDLPMVVPFVEMLPPEVVLGVSNDLSLSYKPLETLWSQVATRAQASTLDSGTIQSARGRAKPRM